jgi:hypothetical protein
MSAQKVRGSVICRIDAHASIFQIIVKAIDDRCMLVLRSYDSGSILRLYVRAIHIYV